MKETLEELLVEELRDLYDAEKQLVRALPRIAKAVSSPELKQAIQMHLEETKGQVQRIEQVFELLDEKARSKPCKAMKGLLEEGKEVMEEDMSEELLDSALIGACQKVEHYEIAGYGTARTLAQAIGKKDAAQLLQETLDEEGATDKKLTGIAKNILKGAMRAQGASGSVEMESRNGGASRGKAGAKTARASGGRNTAGKSGSSRSSNAGGSESEQGSGSLMTTEEGDEK